MTVQIGYDEVRAIAKKIGARVNREIKHTDILDDIASAFGMKGDALMHMLKASRHVPTPHPQALFPITAGTASKGLISKDAFVDKVMEEHERFPNKEILVAAIKLYSMEMVRAEEGDRSAETHFDEFARGFAAELQPFFSAHMEGDIVLIANARLRPGDDPAKILNDHLGDRHGLCRNLHVLRRRGGFRYAVGAWAADNDLFNRDRLVRGIGECRTKAENLAAVCIENPGWPTKVSFVY